MIERFFERAKHGQLIGVLLILSYFLLMFGNGIVSLTHPDEVFYVQSAKEMIAHKSWLTPIIFDWPQFEKPVFFYWLLIIGIKLFGLSPFVARFWPAFFGMLGVVAVYAISWLLFRHKRGAFLSGIVLSSSFIYLALSRAVLTDMVFSILVTIALLCFVWAYYRPQYKDIGLFLFFTVIGIAVLTKGTLGICFTLVPVVAFLIVKRELRFLCTIGSWAGIIALLAIAVPWHLIMYKWYGNTFVHEYWNNVHVRRIFEAEHPKSDKWYFYLGLMFAGVMPWSFWLVPTVKTVYQSIMNNSKECEPLVFLFFWILSIYVFVQSAHSKLASYILPVYPAMAILLGFYLNQFLEKKEGAAPRIIGFLWAALLLAGSVCSIVFAKKYANYVHDFRPVYVVSVLMLACSVALFNFTLRRQYVQLLAANMSVSLILLTLLFLGRPSAEPWVSCQEISDQFKLIPQDQSSMVLTSKFYVRGIRYYTDRKMAVIDINGEGFFSPHPIPFLNTPQKVLDFLIQQPVTYAILKEGDVRQLKEITAGRYEVEHVGEGIGGKYIIKITKI